MPESLKVLGQAAPGATTEVALYAVPALKSATCSTLVICNRSSATITFRVSVAVAAAATAAAQYLYYDVVLTKNSTFTATLGITLGPADVVRVYASTANASFSLFGVEIS